MAHGAAPLFRRLAQSIGDAIEGGTYKIGERLPTEMEFARRHGVSRHTVREALGALRDRGLIESRQGIGSVVVRTSANSGYTETYSSIEELTRFAKGAPLRVLRVETVIADDVMAGALRGHTGQSYLRIVALRPAASSGPPIAHVEVYVDPTYGRIRDHLEGLNVSVAETIEALYDVRIARIEQEFKVELLDREPAELLHAAPKSPAMTIQRWYATDDGRVVEIAVSRYPIGRYAYRNVLVRDKPL